MQNLSKYFIFITMLVITSCSDDKGTNIPVEDSRISFDIKEGNVWYYNWVTVNGQDTVINGNNTIFVKDTATIGGFKCFIEDDNSDRFPTLYAIRTNDDGYYDYSLYFEERMKDKLPQFENGWLKQISFTEEEWTEYDLKNEYKEDDITYTTELVSKGKIEKYLDIEYKGELRKAMITSYHLILIESKTENGITEIDTSGYSYEYTVIKDVGIYKYQDIRFGDTVNFYRQLYDHK